MLMKKENASELLIQEMKNYRQYSQLIKCCEEKIEKYENDAMNVRSPRMDKIGGTTGTMEFNLLKILNQLDIEQAKIEAYSEMQRWILDVINHIENRSLRPDIIRVFIKGEDRRKIAKDRGIIYQLLNKQLHIAVASAVSDKQIEQYNKIRKKMESLS